MKKLNRILALALCCAFLLGTAAFAADTPSSWAASEVNAAISEGLVPAELQKNYTQPISRGAVAQMFVNLLEKSSGKTAAELLAARGAQIDRNAFSDTTDEAVLVCNALGLINGVGDGKFDPNGTLTRAQIAAIMNRAADVLGFSTENYPNGFTDTKGSWVDSELGWVQHVGIISGVGNNQFDPNGKLTTEQAILITYRALKSTTEVVCRKVKETQVRKDEDSSTTTVFTWTYDENGNNTLSKRESSYTYNGNTEDHGGWDVTLTYNEYGDCTSIHGILGGYGGDTTDVFSYTYFADGRIESKTYKNVNPDGSVNGDGRTVTYEYDSQGRVTSDYSSHYEYDSQGHMISDGFYHYEYDQSGHLTKKTEGTTTTEYTYSEGHLVKERETFTQNNGDWIYYSETTYSNFDVYGNACHAEIRSSYRSVDGTDPVTLTSIDYVYEPVKKASLPLHWAGADKEIYFDTIG